MWVPPLFCGCIVWCLFSVQIVYIAILIVIIIPQIANIVRQIANIIPQIANIIPQIVVIWCLCIWCVRCLGLCIGSVSMLYLLIIYSIWSIYLHYIYSLSIQYQTYIYTISTHTRQGYPIYSVGLSTHNGHIHSPGVLTNKYES